MRRTLSLFRSGLLWFAACATSTWLAGCDELTGAKGNPPSGAAPSRFEAVAAKTVADPLKDFCDVRAEAGAGKPFGFPQVSAGAPSDPAKDQFLWLNLWATWCKPCVEEMPRIAAWQKQLAAQGKPIDVRFVSVDEDPATVAGFRAANPNVPESLMLANAAALAPFIADIGLDSGAGLPIHVFVDKGARIRCVRSGAVLDSHYDTITSMLR